MEEEDDSGQFRIVLAVKEEEDDSDWNPIGSDSDGSSGGACDPSGASCIDRGGSDGEFDTQMSRMF